MSNRRPRRVGPVCGAQTRTPEKAGRPCKRPAGWGTDHPGWGRCKLHGGRAPSGRVAAARQEAHAEAVVGGLPLDVEPTEALLHCVRIAAGQVAYVSRQMADLEADEAITDSSAGQGLHPWIRVRHESLDQLARFSKMALDAGVAERQVRIAEQFGEQIASLLSSIFADLSLTSEQQRRAPESVRRHLTLLEAPTPTKEDR